MRAWANNIHVADSAAIDAGVVFIAPIGSQIHVGRSCHIKTGVVINTYGGWVEIGERVSIGEYCVIYGHGGVRIADSSIIGPHCVFAASEHIVGSKVPCRFAGEMTAGISIGAGSWVGARVTIVDGVSIGSNCVIGAGSIVTRSVPEKSLAFGVPCRIVRKIERNRLYGRELQTK